MEISRAEGGTERNQTSSAIFFLRKKKKKKKNLMSHKQLAEWRAGVRGREAERSSRQSGGLRDESRNRGSVPTGDFLVNGRTVAGATRG